MVGEEVMVRGRAECVGAVWARCDVMRAGGDGVAETTPPRRERSGEMVCVGTGAG